MFSRHTEVPVENNAIKRNILVITLITKITRAIRHVPLAVVATTVLCSVHLFEIVWLLDQQLFWALLLELPALE